MSYTNDTTKSNPIKKNTMKNQKVSSKVSSNGINSTEMPMNNPNPMNKLDQVCYNYLKSQYEDFDEDDSRGWRYSLSFNLIQKERKL